MGQNDTKKIEPLRWYEQFLSLPGIIVIAVYACIMLFFLQIVKRDRKEEISLVKISADLFVYFGAASLILISIFVDQYYALMSLAWLSGVCIVELAFRTIRSAYDPLGFFDPFIHKLLKSKNSFVGNFAVETFKNHIRESAGLKRDENSTPVFAKFTINFVMIAKTIEIFRNVVDG